MKDTWASRDLPVLDAAVELADQMFADGRYPDGGDIASRTGLDIRSVGLALNALADEFIEVQRSGDFSRWGVPRVTPAARREVGQWPTAEGIIERLAAGMEQAAETEGDPEQKRRLLTIARELGGAAKSIAVNVASSYFEHRVVQ